MPSSTILTGQTPKNLEKVLDNLLALLGVNDFGETDLGDLFVTIASALSIKGAFNDLDLKIDNFNRIMKRQTVSGATPSITQDCNLGYIMDVSQVQSNTNMEPPVNAKDGYPGLIVFQGGPNSPTWASAWNFNDGLKPVLPTGASEAAIVSWIKRKSYYHATSCKKFFW